MHPSSPVVPLSPLLKRNQETTAPPRPKQCLEMDARRPCRGLASLPPAARATSQSDCCAMCETQLNLKAQNFASCPLHLAERTLDLKIPYNWECNCNTSSRMAVGTRKHQASSYTSPPQAPIAVCPRETHKQNSVPKAITRDQLSVTHPTH